MKKVLRLGRVDENVRHSDADKAAFLERYHHRYGFKHGEIRFRDDSRNCWYYWENLPGNDIRELTHFLQSAGFMPYATHDGIFGYVTQAAVRLFQEYVRSISHAEQHDRRAPPSWPDGVVGSDTRAYLQAWAEGKTQTRWSDAGATPDYQRWLRWLAAASEHYLSHPSSAMQTLRDAPRQGDSLPPEAWTFDPEDTHLIGIRRHTAERTIPGRRPPDDLFILLLQGKSFYFWGSTDPNPHGGREGYLIEGQHRYRLNWHNIGVNRREKIYKAARPAGEGVMVIRDVHDHNALTEANRRDGFDPQPNPTFNIHWSGLGISNWSAGCQVISGKNYLNDRGDLISCTDYAARTDRQRGERRSEGGPRLTMGAYTVLSDLVLCYTRQRNLSEKPTFLYTLFTEEAFGVVDGISRSDLAGHLETLRTEGFY
ncbi:MAG: peptidoglycan-binding protein [Lewinella sp.]